MNDSFNQSCYDDEFHDALRPITQEDLMSAFKRMRLSKVETGSISGLAKIDLD